MKDIRINDRVAAVYLGYGRQYPVMYTGRVKNITDGFVSIYPDVNLPQVQRLTKHWGIGRKDTNGALYFIAPKSRVLILDPVICG